MDTPKTHIIKNIYLYLVCFVTLMMMVVAVGDIIQIGLKKYIFTKADQDMYYPTMTCSPPVPTADKTSPAVKPEDCAKQQADEQKRSLDAREAQRQRDLVRDISFIVVSLPLFAFHWSLVRRKAE